jgi:hypothetical protein
LFADLFSRKRRPAYISSLATLQDVLGALKEARMVEHLMAQLPTEKASAAADLVRGWTAANRSAHLNQFNMAWEDFTRQAPFWS